MARRSMATDDVLVQLLDSHEESLQGDYGNDSNFDSEFRSFETKEPSEFTKSHSVIPTSV